MDAGVQRARRSISRIALRLAERLDERTYIGIDYPPTYDLACRRLPGGERLREVLAANDAGYREVLHLIRSFSDDLAGIEITATQPTEPSWVTGWLPALDSAAIYSFLRSQRSPSYVEIGSGSSTKFAARAKRDGELSTHIVSIDPHPRVEIDQLCDEVIRSPLERADASIFSALQPGDVVFFDGSHRALPDSDVATFFLEVVPALPAGVTVGIHDIYLPDDYPAYIKARHYSEQYLLAAYLLGGGANLTPIFPAAHVSRSGLFAAELERLWDRSEFTGVERWGVAFWARTGGAPP